MHSSILFLAILATWSVLAGCDSSTPEPGLPGIQLATPFPEVDVEEGGEPLVLALGPHFTASPATGALQYSAEPSVPGALVAITGDTLRVTPVSTGEGQVVITATGAHGGRATGVLTVRVLPRCPLEISAGQVALFPDFAPGLEWRYAYRSELNGPTTNYRHTGDAHLRVESVGACSQGTRRLHMSEEITWTAEAYNGSTWVPNPAGDGSRIQRYEWIISDAAMVSEAPWLQGRDGGDNLAPPPFGRHAPRFANAAALSNGVLVLGAPSPLGPDVTIRQEVGPIRYRTTTQFGTAGNGYVEWTLLN